MNIEITKLTKRVSKGPYYNHSKHTHNPGLKLCLCNKSICSSSKPNQKELLDNSDNCSVTESEVELSSDRNQIHVEVIQPSKGGYSKHDRKRVYLITEEDSKCSDDFAHPKISKMNGRLKKALEPRQQRPLNHKYVYSQNPPQNSLNMSEELIEFDVLATIRDSLKVVTNQMKGFTEFMIESNRKSRKDAKSFFGSLVRSISCNSCKGDKGRVKTPTARPARSNFENLPRYEIIHSDSKSENHRLSSLNGSKTHKFLIKNQKSDNSNSYGSKQNPSFIANSGAVRRHIVLYSKERTHFNDKDSDKIRTAATL